MSFTYEFDVEGTNELAEPVTLVIPYDESLIPPGYPEEDLFVIHQTGSDLEPVFGIIDVESNTVTIRTVLNEKWSVAAVASFLASAFQSPIGAVANQVKRIVYARPASWVHRHDLLFDNGDVAADGELPRDGDSVTEHGWERRDRLDAVYDKDGEKKWVYSILSPLRGSDIRYGFQNLAGRTFEVEIYDDLDPSAYTTARFFSHEAMSDDHLGGEIGIMTASGVPGSGDFYSVWDGEWHTTSAARTKGFHTFTIHVQTDQTDYYIDDDLVHSDGAPRAFQIGGIGLFSSPEADLTQEVWFDNISVGPGVPYVVAIQTSDVMVALGGGLSDETEPEPGEPTATTTTEETESITATTVASSTTTTTAQETTTTIGETWIPRGPIPDMRNWWVGQWRGSATVSVHPEGQPPGTPFEQEFWSFDVVPFNYGDDAEPYIIEPYSGEGGIYAFIPRDYDTIPGLVITDTTFIVEPTAAAPWQIHVEKSTGPGGGEIITGEAVWYKLEPDGSLREALRVHAFSGVNISLDVDRYFRPFLGVEYVDTEDGVRVDKVLEDTSAHHFGIRAGDIITTFDNRAILSSADLEEAQELAGLSWVTVTLLRNGRTLDLDLRLYPIRDYLTDELP